MATAAAYKTLLAADADPAAWLAARATMITASDVPVILGIVPGKPKLWYEKVGLLERVEDAGHEILQMGHDLEEVNATTLYVKKTGRRVKRCQNLLQSVRYPWLGATLDYFTWLPGDKKPGPLELKVTGKKDLWPEDGEPAMKFQAQLQTQMLVVDSTWGSLSAIIGSPYVHHRWLDFERDDTGLCDLILSETEAFMASVRAGVNPPVDGDESTNVALRHLMLDIQEGSSTTLPEDAVEWDRELQAARAAAAAWKTRARYYENLMMTAIGEAETGLLPYGAGEYTFKRTHKKAYSVAATSYRQLHRVHAKRPKSDPSASGPTFADSSEVTSPETEAGALIT